MSITKKQHYVSQGILKHFVDSNEKTYELFIEKGIVAKKGIASVMVQNYVYEHPQIQKNAIENAFANKIEKKVFPILDKMIEDVKKSYMDGKSCISYYDTVKKILPAIIVFYFRSGALLQEYSYSSDEPKLDRVERMIYNICDIHYVTGLCKTIIDCYDWAIIIDEKERFLLSDQYLSTVALRYKNKFSNASNRQIGMKDTMLLFPLCSKFYFVFYSGRVPAYIRKDKFSVISDKQVEEINNVIYQNSYVKCVSKFEEELNRVKNAYNETNSPEKCIIKYENDKITDYVIKKEVFFYEEDEDMCKHFFQYATEYLEEIKGKIGRNSLCICGSGKKYKRCCMKKYEAVQKIIHDIQNHKAVNYNISGSVMSEAAIEEFYGMEKDLTNSSDREILKKIENLMS